MIHLKEINLTEAEIQKQKVLSMRSQLKKETEKLKDMLVALNLDYYGTSPRDYYNNIKKEYATDDGYSVNIEKGQITITKRLRRNLTLIWTDTFNETTSFSSYRCYLNYDSGRISNSITSIIKLIEKHKNEINRIVEIIENERIYNPFSEFSEFYSLIDFSNK